MKLGSSIALLSLVALGGTLFFTNPNEEQYAVYFSDTAAEEAQVLLCEPKGFSEWLGKVGEALSSACQSLIANGEALSEEELQALIINNTDRQNRYLFSTYETTTPLGTYSAVGVFNRFFLTGFEKA